MRGAVAGLVVAVGGGLAAWMLMGRGGQSVSEEKDVSKPARIAEVAPAVVKATNAVEAAVAANENTLDGHREGEFWYDAKGTKMITMRRKGKLEHVEVFIPKNRRRPKTHIFKFASENVIAGLLYAKPGATFVGRPNYSGMTADFLKSCEVPIIPSADDDAFTQQLKRDVNQAKIELKQRIDAGEDLGEILSETRRELQKIGQTRREIEQLGREMLQKEGKTVEDVRLIQQSVNKMLEAKGIEPVRFNAIVDFQIKKMQKGEK